MKSLQILSILSLTFSLAACGGGGNSNGSGSPTNGTPGNSPVVSTDSSSSNPCETRSPNTQGWPTYMCYDYSENGCDTGKHELSSASAYCSSLMNDAANNNCAHDLRAASYQQDCGS